MALEVDLDRLADFVGGALDGTPDAEAVRELVSTDDTWAEAYASLVAADALVHRDLRAFAADPVPMPPEVRHRLDQGPWAAPGTPRQASAAPVASVHSLDARRRRRKVVVRISAAAAALVVVGLATVGVLRGFHSVSTDNAGSSAYAPKEASSLVAGVPPRVLMSNRDYSATTLGQVGLSQADSADGLSAPRAEDPGMSGRITRLTDPTAREACLGAIVREYGGQVSLVDFARFDGNPSMVAVVAGSYRAPSGRWIVVVGPACGSGGVDERFSGAF